MLGFEYSDSYLFEAFITLCQGDGPWLAQAFDCGKLLLDDRPQHQRLGGNIERVVEKNGVVISAAKRFGEAFDVGCGYGFTVSDCREAMAKRVAAGNELASRAARTAAFSAVKPISRDFAL